MGEYPLNISLSNRSSFSSKLLFIEQENPDPTDGFLSRAGLYITVHNLLEAYQQDDPDCKLGAGVFIYVYRYDLSLDYTLFASHGTLGERVVQDNLVFTQKIRPEMEDRKALSYPNFGETASSWLGDKVWDYNGNDITPPSFTTDLREIQYSQKVYGTHLLSYKIHRDKYSLALPKRELASSNKYSSVAFAIYKPGPPVWLEIKVPGGVEETDEQCSGGGGGGLDHNPPDPKPYEPPYAPNTDAEQKVDYCTQETISDTSQ